MTQPSKAAKESGRGRKRVAAASVPEALRQVAEAFVDRHKVLYCRHWNGHFCETCATDSLELILSRVFELGRNDMACEIFKSILPEKSRTQTVELLARTRKG